MLQNVRIPRTCNHVRRLPAYTVRLGDCLSCSLCERSFDKRPYQEKRSSQWNIPINTILPYRCTQCKRSLCFHCWTCAYMRCGANAVCTSRCLCSQMLVRCARSYYCGVCDRFLVHHELRCRMEQCAATVCCWDCYVFHTTVAHPEAERWQYQIPPEVVAVMRRTGERALVLVAKEGRNKMCHRRPRDLFRP